ncbi:MAG TPA: VOC family protein [Methanothrix sp.]|nr:VOC family protein [Methanothrix sp.]
MKRIRTCIAFNKEAEKAVNLYISAFSTAFGDSKVLKTTYYGEEELEALREVPGIAEEYMPGPAESVKEIRFQLNGEELLAFNGGSYFGRFTESVSLYVSCKTQDQIDLLWEVLSSGGIEQPCGWLKDRFGVSWQIAPEIIQEIMEGPDQERAQRVMKALYGMKKIEIDGVLKA